MGYGGASEAEPPRSGARKLLLKDMLFYLLAGIRGDVLNRDGFYLHIFSSYLLIEV